MKAADYLAIALERKGVTHVYELIGGMITFLLDSLLQQTSIKIVSMHHEQGAAFAAEGHGRMSGIPGIAMATSGPGATNLLTGIGSCYFDSTPAIFITGQVNRHEMKGDRAIRQLGFQETDIVSMAKPITKWAVLVERPEDLPSILEKAFQIATEGRPGPVLIDIPMDVQRAEVPETTPASPSVEAMPSPASGAFLDRLAQALQAAKKPLILAGGGIRASGSDPAFRQLVEDLQIPVVHSLMAVDVLPSTNPLRSGMIGSYGNRWANLALSESDLLLVLGSRLDVRQTGADTADFKGRRHIFHVDCEPGELNNRVKDCDTLVCGLPVFFSTTAHRSWPRPDHSSWLSSIQALRDQWPDTREIPDVGGINPNAFLHQLSAASPLAKAYVADVGQHQMWAAQSLDLHSDQRFLTSGGMGSMGFALPAAIGACYASGPVVVITGDGGFQCNIQELQTVHRGRLPLKIIVLNNNCHGMVRQFQESYFKERYQSTLWGYDAPSFAAVAAAYGIASRRITEPGEIPSALDDLWSEPGLPYLLEVVIPTMSNAYPKMAFGRPISEMEPFAKPLEMEGT